MFNYRGSYEFVMTDLFVASSGVVDATTAADRTVSRDSKKRLCKSLYLAILSKFPAFFTYCCGCLKPSREETLRAKGLNHVMQEVSISNIIR